MDLQYCYYNWSGCNYDPEKNKLMIIRLSVLVVRFGSVEEYDLYKSLWINRSGGFAYVGVSG